MRFAVIGTDAAGLPIDFMLEARCADEAEYLARSRGINVVKVQLTAGAPRDGATHAPAGGSETRATTPSVPAASAPRISAPAPVRPRVSFGLVSMSLAIVALLFCWIPTVGLISLPLCIIGLVAGGAGLLTAAVQRGGGIASPRLRPGRFLAPVTGIALSGLSLGATVMVATGPISHAHEHADAPAAPNLAVSKSEPPAAPARPLTIVVSGTAADTPRTFDEPAVSRPEPAAAPAVDLSPKALGHTTIRIVSCTHAEVALVGDQGQSAGVTQTPLLLIRLEVRSTHDQPVRYITAAGDTVGLIPAATLRDENGLTLRRAAFGMSIVPAGRTAREELGPGRTLIDVLAFEPPAGAPQALSLTLPGACVGTTGEVVLPVPVPTFR